MATCRKRPWSCGWSSSSSASSSPPSSSCASTCRAPGSPASRGPDEGGSRTGRGLVCILGLLYRSSQSGFGVNTVDFVYLIACASPCLKSEILYFYNVLCGLKGVCVGLGQKVQAARGNRLTGTPSDSFGSQRAPAVSARSLGQERNGPRLRSLDLLKGRLSQGELYGSFYFLCVVYFYSELVFAKWYDLDVTFVSPPNLYIQICTA